MNTVKEIKEYIAKEYIADAWRRQDKQRIKDALKYNTDILKYYESETEKYKERAAAYLSEARGHMAAADQALQESIRIGRIVFAVDVDTILIEIKAKLDADEIMAASSLAQKVIDHPYATDTAKALAEGYEDQVKMIYASYAHEVAYKQ